MCGRFVQIWDADLGRFIQVYVPTWTEENAILQDLKSQDRTTRGYNIGPSRHVGAITSPDGNNRLERVRWGFKMSFKAESGMPIEKEVFNTRIEDAFEKPLWRGLIGKNHAIVPVQGFYEWTGPKSDRVPNYIQRADGKPMLLGAVTGMSRMDAPREPCVSLVTSGPNEFMTTIHNRMPVIVEETRVQDWLSPTTLGVEGVLDLCQPSRAQLKSRTVNRQVNDVANQGPKLLDAEKVQQKRLF